MYTNNNYTYNNQQTDTLPFSAALDNPPPTNPDWNSGNTQANTQYSPASAPAPSYGQPYAAQTQPPKHNRLPNIFSGNQNQTQNQAQATFFQPVNTSDARYQGLATQLAALKGHVVDALKAVSTAQTAEQVDAGEGFLRPFLGDGLGGQLAGTAMNVGTAGYSHWVTNKANKEVKATKQLEQRICETLKHQHPEFSNWITRGKSHDRLGNHKAIFEVGPWLDTANDLLCGGGCFDATSWYLVHRMGKVKDGLRELQGNIESLERSISTQSPGQGGGYSNQTAANAYGNNSYVNNSYENSSSGNNGYTPNNYTNNYSNNTYGNTGYGGATYAGNGYSNNNQYGGYGANY